MIYVFSVFEYKMEKLQMCRMCFVRHARMFKVVNKSLHELYEKLTAKPFVTEDRRPLLVCNFCCAKLKQCYQVQKKCLEAEERYAWMLDEDYEPNPLINPAVLQFNNGFVKTPMELISIDGECPIESLAIKEEEPADCVIQAVIIESKEDLHIDELEAYLEKPDSSDIEVIQLSDSEDDVSIMEFKTEVVEDQDTNWEPVAKKPKLPIRRITLEDVIKEEQKNNEQSDSKVVRTIQNCTSKQFTKFNKPSIDTKPRVDHSSSLNNNNIDASFCDNSGKGDIRCKISSKDNGTDDETRHQRRCVKEKCYKCEVCQYSKHRKDSLIRHIRIHSNEKPYKCEVCQYSCNHKSNLTRHIRRYHTKEKPYKCEVCQYSCNQKSNLTRHIRRHHTEEKPYKCEVCQYSCNQKSNLTRHIQRRHTEEKPFECDICQRRFSEKKYLTQHVGIHTNEKPYKCEVCQRDFRQKNNFIRHIRLIHGRHTQEKPYKCEVCQYSCYEKAVLTKHVRIHTGDKPFKCEVCHYRCHEKCDLTKHILRRHTEEKPYECDICQRSYNLKGDLNRHFRTHIGEKSHKCDVCQHSFNGKGSLKIHILKHHTGEKA